MSIKTKKYPLSAGTIKRCFPVVCSNLSVGGSGFVQYYGDNLKITHTGCEEYDFVAEEIIYA